MGLLRRQRRRKKSRDRFELVEDFMRKNHAMMLIFIITVTVAC